MTIFGAFMLASFVLTSCGGPESDGQADSDCICKAYKMDNTDNLNATAIREAYAKCVTAAEKNLAKYKEEGEEALKKYNNAGTKAMKDCEEDWQSDVLEDYSINIKY